MKTAFRLQKATTLIVAIAVAHLCPVTLLAQEKKNKDSDRNLKVTKQTDSKSPKTGTNDETNRKPQLVVQLGHSVGVLSVAFSPDGRLALTGSWDWDSILWEVNSGRQIRKFVGHSNLVTSVSFSPDGRFALTGSWDKTARLWDVTTGRELQRFEGHSDHLESVAFSSDGNSILTGSKDGTARLWNPQTGQENLRLDLSGWGVTSAVFSPGDDLILTGCADGTARLWDARTGRSVRLFRHDPNSPKVREPGRVNSVAYSHAGRLVLTGGDDSTAQLWDALTGQRIDKYYYHDRGKVLSVAFSPDDRNILIGGEHVELSRSIHVWEVSTRRELWRTEGRIKAATFSPDGRLILTTDGQQLVNTVRLLDSATGKEVLKFEGSSGPVYSAAFSPDMNYLFTSGTSVTSSLWDLQDGKVRWGLRDSHDGQAPDFSSPMSDRIANYSFAFSPDSRSLVVSEQTNTFVFNVENSKPVSALQGERYEEQPRTSGRIIVTSLEPALVKAVAFSPDGKLALTGSTGKVVRLWDVADSKEIRRLKGHTGAVEAASFSPDGQLIVTGSSDKTARLWEVSTGRELMVFAGHFDGINSVAFSPDKNFILTGSGSLDAEGNLSERRDYTARLWDTKTGKAIQRFTGHQSLVMSVGFSPDGLSVFTGGFDGTARLWDRITGREIRQFTGHSDIVKSVSFSPDGRFVLTASYDSTARLWDASKGRELCRLISFRDGNWVVVDPEGRFDTNNLEEIKGLHWIMPDDPMKPLPIEIFMRDYYEPRLLPRILNGERFKPIRSLAELNRVQPVVKITGLEQQTDNPELVNVAVEVSRAKGEFKQGDTTVTRETGVYDLRLFRDGQLVGYAPESSGEVKLDPATGKATRTFPVRIPRTSNTKQVTFSAYAFNVDRVKSETDRKTLEAPSTLSTVKGKAYVISVGVNAYEQPAFNLNFAANDARRIQSVISDNLSKAAAYSEIIQIPLIADSQMKYGKQVVTEKAATKANIKAVLDALAGRKVAPELLKEIPSANKLQPARPEDLVLISFASHGFTDDQGNFYFVPYDVGSVSNQPSEDELIPHCISSEELSLWLRDVDAGDMVMVVDACHSAATVETGGFKPGPMGSRGLGQLAYDKGMKILTATQVDNVALESEKLNQGLLTYSLINDGIERGLADSKPKDGRITLDEWLEYGERRVPDLYEAIRIGKLPNYRGPKVADASASKAATNLQRPSLFNFARLKREVVIATSLRRSDEKQR